MVKTALARAKKALGDHDAVLAALLDAWRESPCAPLADAIAAVPVTSPPIATGKDWLRVAAEKNPSALPRLLDELLRVGKVEAFLDWPRDPRLARFSARWAKKPPFAAVRLRLAFYEKLFPVLARQKDPEAAKAIGPLLVHPEYRRPWEAAGGRALVEKPLGAADAKTLAAIVASLVAGAKPARAARPTTDPLAAVYANPDDDDARLVAADWLSDRGDPRGELIGLQLGGKRTPRARQLEKQFGREWLGPLEPSLLRGGLVYRRGFPAEGEYLGKDGDGTHREWATFERLDVGPTRRHSGDRGAELLFGGACRALREVRGVRARWLDRLDAKAPVRWTSLGAEAGIDAWRAPPRAALPALRTLHVGGMRASAPPKTFADWPLEHLTLVIDEPNLEDLLAFAAKHPTLQTFAVCRGAGWDGQGGDGWRVRLERAAPRWRLRVDGAAAYAELVAALATAPRGAFELVIGVLQKRSAECDRQLARLR